MKPAVYDLAIFDWDGTLSDSVGNIVNALQAAGQVIGVDIPREAARSIIGLGIDEARRRLLPNTTDEHKLETFYHTYRNEYLHRQDEISLFPGVRTLLNWLTEQNYLIAVATGKSRLGLDRALSAAKLTNYFHATKTVDEATSKPSPAMVHQLLRELNVESSRTILIGDTTHDLQMAQGAGIDAIAVTYGAHSEENLRAENPLALISDVGELHEWFRQKTFKTQC